jgi:hypothetical protein
MYIHSWRLYFNISQDLPVSLMKIFLVKSKISVMGLLAASAGLSGFLNYWTADYRNLTVYARPTCVYVCS